jgi:hypothetical protein
MGGLWQEVRRLAAIVLLSSLPCGIWALVANDPWKFIFLGPLLVGFAIAIPLRLINVFWPLDHRVRRFWKRLIVIYGGLLTAQKLYVNVCIVTVVGFIYLRVGGAPIGQVVMSGLLAFYAYVVVYDVIRWYKAFSEKLLARALIALGFAAASNMAYSFAGQVVADVVKVTPVGLVHATFFVTILMIPVVMMIISGGVYLIGIVASSAIMAPSLFGFDPSFSRWLFAGTLRPPEFRYVGITRAFQIIFYATVSFMTFTLGQRVMPWYENVLKDATRHLVFTYDMYPGTECELSREYKIAPLGDSTFLVAKAASPAKTDLLTLTTAWSLGTNSAGIDFLPPVKCELKPPMKGADASTH